MRPLFPFRVLPVIALMMLVLFCSYSCKKAKKTTVPYDFTYAGGLFFGDTISFSNTAPSTSTFFWKFGDGTTSTMANPFHIYTSTDSVDSFVVTLIVNGDVVDSIHKTLVIVTPPPTFYTHLMGGVRHWHGYYWFSYPSSYFDTTYYYPDTSFAISVLSDSLISVFGNTYSFYSSDSVNKINYFGIPVGTIIIYSSRYIGIGGTYGGYSDAWTFYYYQAGFGVAYFYNKDSLAFVRGDKGMFIFADVRYTY